MTKIIYCFEGRSQGLALHELGKASMIISETSEEANADILDQGGVPGGCSAFMWLSRRGTRTLNRTPLLLVCYAITAQV
jgi:hypothetical protein